MTEQELDCPEKEESDYESDWTALTDESDSESEPEF